MFPSAHQRYLLSRLHYIDEMLGEAVLALDPGLGGRLFKRVTPDATPVQRKILTDYVSQIRYVLEQFMLAQHIEEGRAPPSGLWSMRTAVIFAQTAIAEMRPSYLRGYGAFDADAAAACERVVAELTALLKRVSDYLDKGEHGDLAARLTQLDAARADVVLLRQLERVVTAHGMVEFRAPLEDLIARAAHPRYEVAVFGRVNAGKTSLLNWWLGADILPTGVTPITAVLTRIVHGQSAQARVRIAASAPADVVLEDIAAYVTEAGNPGNSRHVIGMTVEFPSERLSEGVCLVDTPGLGSLAVAGAVQTLEYLPRCDLAIQMIEAGAPIGFEEIALARTVVDGGSDILVVLSKADRLSDADRAGALTYAAEQFKTALGLTVPVDPVSTVRGADDLAADWFARQVMPRIADHRARAAAQLARKIEILRERVTAALEVRLRSTTGHHTAQTTRETARVPERGAQCRLALERARDELLSLIPRIRDQGQPWLITGAADGLTGCWVTDRKELATRAARVEAAIAHRAIGLGELVTEVLTRCRRTIQTCIMQPSANENSGVELPQAHVCPLFDTAGLTVGIRTVEPTWIPKIPLLLARTARRRVDTEDLRTRLRDRLLTYTEALRLWSATYLEELTRAVDEALMLEESRDRMGSGERLTPADLDAVRRDLALLASTGQQDDRTHAGQDHEH